jgi:hypothetical protein
MRVRPFFWFLLALSCASVLIFAATWQTYAPELLQVHIPQQPRAVGFTTLELHLTDPEGLPIDPLSHGAQVQVKFLLAWQRWG